MDRDKVLPVVGYQRIPSIDELVYEAAIAQRDADWERVKPLVEAAKEVMSLLEEHGPSIVPHLLDTDENAGQRLREALAQLGVEVKG